MSIARAELRIIAERETFETIALGPGFKCPSSDPLTDRNRSGKAWYVQSGTGFTGC
jgi:hypothetical protein